MTQIRQEIETTVGFIKGRNAIHLDKVVQEENILIFHGEFSAPLCSNYSGKGRWLGYEFKFSEVRIYKCWELDLYPDEKKIISSFDVVKPCMWNSDLDESKLNYYVLSTYDYIYEIIAKDYVLALVSER